MTAPIIAPNAQAGRPAPPGSHSGGASLVDAVRVLVEGADDPDAQACHLERVVDLLRADEAVMDDETAKHIQSLLLNLASRPEPQGGGQGSAPAERPSARGLAARGLIRLYAHTRDKALPAAIEGLSKDGADAVRSGVAADLHILFGADPSLADRIAARYASSKDPSVPSRMPAAAFWREIDREDGPPIDTGVFLACIADPHEFSPCVDTLLHSALAVRNAPARDLLDRILAAARLSWEIRQAVLDALGKSYLFDPRAQDGALEVLSTLLDSEDPATRENAAFVLTSSIERAGDPAAYVQRIAPHIGKMAGEADRDDRSHKMLETLTSFLKRHCHLMPELALGHLERAARLPKAPDRPQIEENTVEALDALLRTPADGDGRRRCIAVLRRFAAAGHPGALDALRRAGEA